MLLLYQTAESDLPYALELMLNQELYVPNLNVGIVGNTFIKTV